MYSKFATRKNPTSGFSVIELLITISIIVLVTGLALSRYASFDNTVLLQSQAFEIAFDIRQAQQSGISVRATGADTRSAFGIHFDIDKPSQYIFFQDLNNNNVFDDGSGVDDDETLQTFFIDTRFVITDILIDSTSRSNARVLFKRPNFDARIFPSGGDLEIVLEPTRGSVNSKTIRVTQTGQITVQ